MTVFDSPFVYHAWLSSVQLPPELLQEVLRLHGSPAAVFSAVAENDKTTLEMLPEKYLAKLRANAVHSVLAGFDRLMSVYRIRALSVSDGVFPEALTQIPDPPAILFYQGDTECLQRRMLSVVGSRAASYSGQKAARNLAKELSFHGVSVVSGMACGIDASAHWGCIEGGSPTLAVTGCGLDIVYPRENQKLHDEILGNGGLIVSEYIPGEKPYGWHFPVRNRILTGLGKALILVEARIRSGSMTSVQHALDQGRDVFVYPGDPESGSFEGNHLLLREGAVYFTNASDILEDMGWLDNQPIVRQNIDCSSTFPAFSQAEESVIRALRPGTLGFEQLLDLCGLSPAELMSTLTILQVKGIVESLPGKSYQIKIS